MSVPAAKVTGCGIPETKQQHECLKSQIPGINPRKPLFKRGSSSNDLHAHAQQASYTHRKRYISTLSKQPPHHAQNLRSYQHSHEAVPSLPMDPLPWYLPSTTENEKKKKTWPSRLVAWSPVLSPLYRNINCSPSQPEVCSILLQHTYPCPGPRESPDYNAAGSSCHFSSSQSTREQTL